MDSSIQKALNDKLYDKRRNGALEVEKLVRDSVAAENNDRIRKIVDQLCHDYAYAVHQPYARNGGLIGLAAASIALGPGVAPYLEQIIPPVLACFNDQDARVRYYACESMYNIVKTCKAEILPYFNEVFDAMAKLAADSEPSVKNGAELLDRLVKDIVSESAATYVSIVHPAERPVEERDALENPVGSFPTAFSLSRFIPLLKERINVINPFTRMFLVQWITLLDSIPDLELVSYLPSFLAGLFRFLHDSSQDVVTSTQHVLERFLDEIQHIARVKREIAANRLLSSQQSRPQSKHEEAKSDPRIEGSAKPDSRPQSQDAKYDDPADNDNVSDTVVSSTPGGMEDDFIPGQDVFVDHPKILDVLLSFLGDQSEHVQVTALRWIDGFFEISPDDLMPHVSELLNQVLPLLSSEMSQVRKAAARVNVSLVSYIEDTIDEEELERSTDAKSLPQGIGENKDHKRIGNEAAAIDKSGTAEQLLSTQASKQSSRHPSPPGSSDDANQASKLRPTLDYDAAVNALTQQFLNNNEATRAASLSWLIMLQKKAPKKVLAAHDTTFPALLRTLADPSDTVVTRDLQLLCQISKHTSEAYFEFFMINLLQHFADDRRLLETRGNLIIRQLCLNLSPERIFRAMAGCLEKHDDPEFASTMVQNLNNNLITAPELGDLRKKLRNWDSRDGQTLFVVLFRAWCNNAVATIALCLLAQAYEQAYNLLHTFADIDITVNMLIQIDKLVQLLESPVFTFLRLQLLEPERYPYLYRCLYGILMLLPQSAAFAALKNRLNSVSAIGYLHVPQVPPTRSSVGGANSASNTPATTPVATNFERGPGRLKSKEEGPVKWAELLERFKNAQERGRRSSRSVPLAEDDQQNTRSLTQPIANAGPYGVTERRLLGPAGVNHVQRSKTSPAAGSEAPPGRVNSGVTTSLRSGSPNTSGQGTSSEKEKKSRFSAARFGKLTGGVKGSSKK